MRPLWVSQGNKCGCVHKCSINIRLLPFQPPQPSNPLPVSSFLLFFWLLIYIQWICYSSIYFRVPEEGLKSLFVRSWNNCAVEAHRSPPLCRWRLLSLLAHSGHPWILGIINASISRRLKQYKCFRCYFTNHRLQNNLYLNMVLLKKSFQILFCSK